MASKRDVLVVRLAIKWKWLTPEEGEDVLFLKRKFGSKLTVEQIIRRRGYLDWEEIDQLAEAATQTMGRRARPLEREAADRPAAPKEARPRSAIAIQEETTSPRHEQFDEDTNEEFRDEGKTVIAAMPELLEKVLARAAERAASDPRATILDDQTILTPAFPKQEEDDFENREPTIYDKRPPHLGVTVEPVPSPMEPVIVRRPSSIVERPVLDPAYLIEEGDAPPSEEVRNKAPIPGAVPQAMLTIVRDEAGDEFLEGDFGAYAIERVIARGRASIVYLAKHRESGDQVALKVLEMPPAAAARFFSDRGDELVNAARLVSPNVVRTLDVGRVGEKYYVALQYIDGWTLEEMLDAGDRPSYVRVAEIGRDLANALAAAESQKILHLDVRPDHVMIAESGQALLTGFGFAPDRPGRGGKVRGTPEYMAPEQLAGTPDHRSDLYGLGATLYRVLTGKVPVEAAVMQAGIATIDVPPVDPRTIDPQIPEALAAIVVRLLQKRREARYQNAREVYEQLDQLIFDMEAAGFQEAPAPEPPAMRPLLVRAAIGSLGLVGVSLVGTIALDAAELWSGPEAARTGAFFGMAGLMAASVLLSTVALIRRGQLPLPMSSAWLVRMQESSLVLGALALVAGFVLAPPAVLNVMVGSIAIVVLMSGVFGTLLRRSIAKARADGGVGRMLAVLGDPSFGRWRAVHVPLIACLTALATARFAVMAYFAS